MSRYPIESKKLKAVGPYSVGVATKNLTFFSGQIPLDAKSGKLVGETIEGQTKQAFKNVAAALDAAGLDFDDVVKVTVYLIDMADFAAMNEIYQLQFEAPYPARTTIAVAALPLGARVEIEVIAEGGPLTP